MEKELYQMVAEEVRNEIKATIKTSPNAYVFLRDPVTLKGVCQDTAVMVREKLKKYGIDSRLLNLYLKQQENEWGCNQHIVVGVKEDVIIDPTLTQYFPDSKQFVFRRDAYPVPILGWKDLSDSQFLR